MDGGGKAAGETAEIAEVAEMKADAPKTGNARTDMEEREAKEKTVKDWEAAEVIIHESGNICSYAPEFGKQMKKQVMEIRFKLDRGIGECVVKMVFWQQEAYAAK